MAALSREFQEDLSELGQRAQGLLADGEKGSQMVWSEVNKRVMATASSLAAPRELISAIDPEALCFFDAAQLPGARGRVALTIDDAPCHVPDADRCMMDEVRLLLQEHGARATFFLCTDFVPGHEASLEALLRAGHEVANHAGADRPYGGDSEAQFEAQLLASEAICDELRRRAGPAGAAASAAPPAGSSPPPAPADGSSPSVPSPSAPRAPADGPPAAPAGSPPASADGGSPTPLSLPAPRSPRGAASAAASAAAAAGAAAEPPGGGPQACGDPPAASSASSVRAAAAEAAVGQRACGAGPAAVPSAPCAAAGAAEPEQALGAGRAAASASAVLPSQPLRWFRAPHADVSGGMRRVLRRHGFTNVLCDCFASDTTIIDPRFIARTLLSQVDRAGEGGSILVIHAPERGFREHNLEALRLLLAGLTERGLAVVTVSDLTKAVLAGGASPAEA